MIFSNHCYKYDGGQTIRIYIRKRSHLRALPCHGGHAAAPLNAEGAGPGHIFHGFGTNPFASSTAMNRLLFCLSGFSVDQGVKSAPISAPFVPAPFRSLPDASFRKLPMFGEPSELRLTDGVRLTKSAELTTSPLPFVL